MIAGPQNLPADLANVLWIGKQPRPECYPPNSVVRHPDQSGANGRAMATDEDFLFYGYRK